LFQFYSVVIFSDTLIDRLVDWFIDWLVFHANFSSISSISWRE